ncbi:hypothetical protein V2O64_18555 [Verrucomicrobiaceae bacterium 227]
MNIKCLALALLLLPLHGQEIPNRFKKTPDLPKSPDDLPVVVTNSIEHFLVTKEDLHQWQASHPDEKITRELVANWIDQGQASLAETFFISTRLEKNLTLRTGHLLNYPVQYVPPKFPGEWNIPDAFDHKNLGHHIDTIFKLDDRQQLVAKLTFGDILFTESDSHSILIENTRNPDDLFMPIFKTFRQYCEMTYLEGTHHLAGIFDSLEDKTNSLLVFSEAQSVALEPVPSEAPEAGLPRIITVSSELMEVSSETWTNFCHGKTPDQLRVETATWAATLLQEEKAIQLKMLSGEILPGKKKDLNPKAAQDSIINTYKPTDPSKKLSPSNPLMPTDVVAGFKDFVLEITPEITPSRHVLLTYIWQMHTPWKSYVIHRVSDGEEWTPDAWAPCRAFSNLEGAVFLNPGQNTLVGALPVESNQADQSTTKMRLFFLKAE